jgi:two-component system response regulator RegA
VLTAGNYTEAVALAGRASPDMAVVDLRMPDRSGLELVRALRDLSSEMRVVILTAYASIDTAVDAVHLGANAYVSKPANLDTLLAAIQRAEDPLAYANVPRPVEPPPVGSLSRAEWEHIYRVLESADGNVSEAARRLGIHRRSLQRKLKKPPG